MKTRSNTGKSGAKRIVEYRELPHGDEAISVIGMGSSVVGAQQEANIIKTVQYALDKPGVLTVLGGPGLEDNNRI